MQAKHLFEVAVAAPLHHTLTYAARPDDAARLRPCFRVLVPLTAGRLVTGYVLACQPEAPAGKKIKYIAEILDESPLFPEAMLQFFRWISDYYQFPIGEVIKTALPGGLSTSSGRRIELVGCGREEISRWRLDHPDTATDALPWLDQLISKGMLPPATVRRLWRGRERKLLEAWSAAGWLRITSQVIGDTIKSRTETCVTLAASLLETNGGAANDKPVLTPAGLKVVAIYRDLAGQFPDRPVPRREITSRYPGAGRILRILAEQGLASYHERQVYRDPFGEPVPDYPPPAKLSDEQQESLAVIIPAIRAEQFSACLIHGVTGSGKTEIYLQAAAAALEQGRGVLVLVPEIALAAQLEGQFLSRFGDRVALLHSGLSAGERFDQWNRVRDGSATVVLGARSAVFAPLADPGLIIVDEEHDGAYKQEDGLRYQARDLAVLRAKFGNGVVILGSATPSLISYHHAKQRKYRLLELKERIDNRPLPEVKIVDLRQQDGSKTSRLFSPELLTALRETLARGEQSLVFLNRRGYANLMLCRDCGLPVHCRHCNVSLTLHKQRRILLCHYCGFSCRTDAACPQCRSTNLVAIGFGTERLEDEIRQEFPGARLARLDSDTNRNRRDFLATLKAMRHHEIDILLGTQMIAKGHHFPRVTLVGIVSADAGLGLPDFRAGERTFQLISQVSGRSGRGDRPGRVIIQTFQPGHHSIILAQSHDYGEMFRRELATRRQFDFPPFTRQILFRVEGQDEDSVQKLAKYGADYGRQLFGKTTTTTLLGPAPAPLTKVRDLYRWQFLLQGKNIDQLHGAARKIMAAPQAGGFGNARLALDVDPDNML